MTTSMERLIRVGSMGETALGQAGACGRVGSYPSPDEARWNPVFSPQSDEGRCVAANPHLHDPRDSFRP